MARKANTAVKTPRETWEETQVKAASEHLGSMPIMKANEDVVYTIQLTELDLFYIHMALVQAGYELASANYEFPNHHTADMRMVREYGEIIKKVDARKA